MTLHRLGIFFCLVAVGIVIAIRPRFNGPDSSTIQNYFAWAVLVANCLAVQCFVIEYIYESWTRNEHRDVNPKDTSGAQARKARRNT